MTRTRTLLAALLASLFVVLLAAPAAADAALEMRVEIGGRVARDRAGAAAIPLDPHRKIPLRIEVTNVGDAAVRVRHVVLAGQAVGFQFVTYDVDVNRRVPPGETRVIVVRLDLYDLGRQATGYLAASVRLYDAQRNLLAQQKFVMDVQGTWTSTIGIFSIVLFFLAVFSLVMIGLRLYRHELSRNRAVRGLQFMLAGAAIGLLLALGLPAMRWTTVTTDGWIPLVIGPMAIGFVLGYLAPGPISYTIADAREDEMLDIVATQALERMSAEHTAQQAPAEAARRSGETVVSGGTALARSGETVVSGANPAHGPAPATTVVPGDRTSGPAPATTVVPGDRTSGPAPATTVVPGDRTSGPAPATTATPAATDDEADDSSDETAG
jgi:hypothetical protein